MKLRQVKFLKSVKPYQLYAKMQPKLLIFLIFLFDKAKNRRIMAFFQFYGASMQNRSF